MSIPQDKVAYFVPENIEREVGSYLVSKQKLGEGGTAVVKLAWNRQRKDLAAVKILAKYRLTDRGRDNLEREYVAPQLFSLQRSASSGPLVLPSRVYFAFLIPCVVFLSIIVRFALTRDSGSSSGRGVFSPLPPGSIVLITLSNIYRLVQLSSAFLNSLVSFLSMRLLRLARPWSKFSLHSDIFCLSVLHFAPISLETC